MDACRLAKTVTFHFIIGSSYIYQESALSSSPGVQVRILQDPGAAILGREERTLNGHNTHLTYGRFHNNAMTTTYAAITPNVIACVLFTVNPRRSKWCEATAGPPITSVRRASLARDERVDGAIAGAMLSLSVFGDEREIQGKEGYLVTLENGIRVEDFS